MKRILYIMLFGLCVTAYSCENWLDVKPKKTTEEEELFSREEGFKEALTGAYIKVAKPDLYGTTLSFGFMDIIAQRYRTSDDKYQNENYYDYTPDNTVTSPTVKGIWKNSYNVIANLNNMLYWVDKNKSVFRTDGYYEIIKGEGLALRSYLYFDLLRMFGPVYKTNPTGKSIPYRTHFNRDVKELEPANKVLDNIIIDLLEAHELLKNDPLDFEVLDIYGNDKTGAEGEEDGFLLFRFKRMNLLAVKGLLARVYLYKGDSASKVLAAQYADEVLASKKVSLAKNNTNDRLLSSELIFGFHVDDFKNKVTNLIDSTSRQYVITGDAFFEELFNTAQDGLNDFRVRDSDGFTLSGAYRKFLKYDQTGLRYAYQATMPMIRIAEMYYILAECATSDQEAATYLNTIREARGIGEFLNINTPEQKLAYLELEYRKEFYGEGQLWYFYKRNYFRSFLHCPVEQMNEENYVFSVPNDEFQFGSISNE